MTTPDLLAYLFDSEPHVLWAPMAGWLAASPPFARFVETYRDKIRKKIRDTRGVEGIGGLQAEFETAYWLLPDRGWTLAYEPYAQGKTRGPDFAVTFHNSLTFNVEVTHVGTLRSPVVEAPAAATVGQPASNRIIDTVCGKLGQMVPGMMNFLVIVASEHTLENVDLSQAMHGLKRQVERRDAALFARYGFRGPPDFFKLYQHLSGVVLRWAGLRADPVLWLNPQAKQPVPAKVRTILARR